MDDLLENDIKQAEPTKTEGDNQIKPGFHSQPTCGIQKEKQELINKILKQSSDLKKREVKQASKQISTLQPDLTVL